MWPCLKCSEPLEDTLDACWKCGTSWEGVADPKFRPERQVTAIDAAAAAGPRGFFRCSRCKTPVDPGRPRSCRGCGAALQETPVPVLRGGDDAGKPAGRMWITALSLLTLPGLLSVLYLLLAIGSAGINFAKSDGIWTVCSAAIFVAVVAWIIHIDRHAGRTEQSLPHFGCLLLLVGVALLFGVMAGLGLFFRVFH